MDTKKLLTTFSFAVAAAMAQGLANDPETARILGKNEAEQKAYLNSAFDHGLPQASVNAVTTLLRQKSAIFVPVLGVRVLEALKSPSPIDCFADKSVDPQAAIMATASAIAYAADENALKELGQFLAVDEKRFGWLVGFALSDGGSRNFFPVAYSGFASGSPALDARMTAWIEKQLADDADSTQGKVRSWWADALVDRLGHAPTAADWASDPIAKRLKPDLAKSLREDVFRLAGEEMQRRTEH